MSDALAKLVGWTVLHSLWEGLVIGFALWVVLRVLRSSSSQARYVLSGLALVAMLVAPLATACFTVDLRPAAMGGASGAGIAAAEPWWKAMQAQMDGWTQPLTLVWLAGFVLMLGRICGGIWVVTGMRRGAQPVDCGAWQTKFGALAERMGVRRKVKLMASADIRVPSALGVLKAVVLVPTGMLATMSPAQVEALLAHELAHVRRHDYLLNLVQSVVEAALFYHPVAWCISGCVRAEREHCCDDIAVRAMGDRVALAEALVSLEEIRSVELSLAMTANGGSLMRRINRILWGTTPRTSLGTVLALTLGAMAVILPLMAWADAHPQNPRATVVDQAWPTLPAISKQIDEALSDPNTKVTINGKTKLVKDLTPAEKAQLKRKLAAKTREMERAMEAARKATNASVNLVQNMFGSRSEVADAVRTDMWTSLKDPAKGSQTDPFAGLDARQALAARIGASVGKEMSEMGMQIAKAVQSGKGMDEQTMKRVMESARHVVESARAEGLKSKALTGKDREDFLQGLEEARKELAPDGEAMREFRKAMEEMKKSGTSPNMAFSMSADFAKQMAEFGKQMAGMPKGGFDPKALHEMLKSLPQGAMDPKAIEELMKSLPVPPEVPNGDDAKAIEPVKDGVVEGDVPTDVDVELPDVPEGDAVHPRVEVNGTAIVVPAKRVTHTVTIANRRTSAHTAGAAKKTPHGKTIVITVTDDKGGAHKYQIVTVRDGTITVKPLAGSARVETRVIVKKKGGTTTKKKP